MNIKKRWSWRETSLSISSQICKSTGTIAPLNLFSWTNNPSSRVLKNMKIHTTARAWTNILKDALARKPPTATSRCGSVRAARISCCAPLAWPYHQLFTFKWKTKMNKSLELRKYRMLTPSFSNFCKLNRFKKAMMKKKSIKIWMRNVKIISKKSFKLSRNTWSWA